MLSIPCLLYPLFVLPVQLHLEDQLLPVHIVYISRIKRFNQIENVAIAIGFLLHCIVLHFV